MNQETIKDWFNNTYTTRGFSYLRPKEAYYIFMELLGVKSNEKLLDVACGLGQLLKVANDYDLDMYGVDISDVAIEMAKAQLPTANLSVANAETLPFENETFDYITCLGSLERMLDLNAVLKEQVRVAKPNAKFCYMVRNSERASWKVIKNGLGIINKKGHQGAKSMAEWTEIFEKQGLKVEQVHQDQWPNKRWYRWLSLQDRLRKVDYKKIDKPIANMEQAYEFIFILSKG